MIKTSPAYSIGERKGRDSARRHDTRNRETPGPGSYFEIGVGSPYADVTRTGQATLAAHSEAWSAGHARVKTATKIVPVEHSC